MTDTVRGREGGGGGGERGEWITHTHILVRPSPRSLSRKSKKDGRLTFQSDGAFLCSPLNITAGTIRNQSQHFTAPLRRPQHTLARTHTSV